MTDLYRKKITYSSLVIFVQGAFLTICMMLTSVASATPLDYPPTVRLTMSETDQRDVEKTSSSKPAAREKSAAEAVVLPRRAEKFYFNRGVEDRARLSRHTRMTLALQLRNRGNRGEFVGIGFGVAGGLAAATGGFMYLTNQRRCKNSPGVLQCDSFGSFFGAIVMFIEIGGAALWVPGIIGALMGAQLKRAGMRELSSLGIVPTIKKKTWFASPYFGPKGSGMRLSAVF